MDRAFPVNRCSPEMLYLRDLYYPTYTRLDGLLFGVVLAGCATGC